MFFPFFSDVLTAFFVVCAVLQIAYWLVVFRRVAFFEEKQRVDSEAPAVSIVICGRNEAENFQKNLPSILTQQYAGAFEVVVVNDASTDESQAILENLVEKYAHLRVLHLKEKTHIGKKAALSAGIAVANYPILLLTDADCQPQSAHWLSIMAHELGANDIGLGVSPYAEIARKTASEKFLNLFIRFEALWTAIQYLGFASIGQAYMGVGRNLIYRRKTYEAVGGFSQHAHIASGDDDLFVQNVVESKNKFKNISIILKPESFMVSEPKTRWKDYFTQKTRHFTTASHYSLRHKIGLGLLSFSHFGFYASFLALILLQISTIIAIFFFIMRMFVVLYFYDKICTRFRQQSLLKFVILLDAFFVFFYIAFAPALFIRTTQNWK
jgi:poly-beta-1,6-N-acetyl-D-glucosamine synthase